MSSLMPLHRRADGGNPRQPVVAHHPAGHPYVAHACTGADETIEIDVFDVDALVRRGVTVVHLHFGFEHRSATQLHVWADALDRAGIALVHTAHDLDNPHLVDQTDFHAAVAAVARRSSAVFTLTRFAQALLAERCGVRAEVLPHPHIVDRALLETQRDGTRPFADLPGRRSVYVHASTLRPNLDLDLLERFARCAVQIGGLVVHVRDSADRVDIARLRDRLDLPGAIVLVERRLTDAQLWQRIAQSALLLLPYRWGTHSGLLEAASDLHVPTLAPPFGGYVDQGAHPIDDGDLVGSVARAVADPPCVSPVDRIDQADRLVGVHADLYAAVGSRRIGRLPTVVS